MTVSFSMIALSKALISLTVLLAWSSCSFFIGSRGGATYRHGSAYLNLMQQSDSKLVNVPDVNSYLDALRFPSERLKAIKRLTAVSDDKFVLSAGDCKMIMAAAIEIRSEEILADALQLFKSTGYLNSELLYVGVRIACKKKVWNLAYQMLLTTHQNGFVSDTDAVNSVVQLLARYGKINEAWNLIELAHQKKFGPDADCDLSSFFAIISCAGRAHSDVMVKAFKTMEKNFRVEIDENIFLAALNTCSLAGDFTAAIEIFTVYERLYGVVQTRAYCLLLMSYVSSKDSMIGVKTPKLDSVVTFLVKSNIDSSVTISNLIFQFFCVREDVSRAAIYLDRMRSLLHRPSTNALLSYVTLVLKLKDRTKAIALHAFMCRENFIPSLALVALCLDSLHEVSSAEVAAQIFRNAVVKGQESNTGQLLAVAQLCVGEKKYSALSSILNEWLAVDRIGAVTVEKSEVVSLIVLLLDQVPPQYINPLIPNLIQIFLDLQPEVKSEESAIDKIDLNSDGSDVDALNGENNRGDSNSVIENRLETESGSGSEIKVRVGAGQLITATVETDTSLPQNTGISGLSSEDIVSQISNSDKYSAYRTDTKFSTVNRSTTEALTTNIIAYSASGNNVGVRATSGIISGSVSGGPGGGTVPFPDKVIEKSEWETFRLQGYIDIIGSLLKRGGCRISIETVLKLLPTMIVTEQLVLNQPQIRSFLYIADLHDQGPVTLTLGPGSVPQGTLPPGTISSVGTSTSDPGSAQEAVISTYGNAVRVFLKLRELSITKADKFLYTMVIKSITKRRKRIQMRVKLMTLQNKFKQTIKFTPHSTTQDRPPSYNMDSDWMSGEKDPGSDSDLDSLTFVLDAMKDDGVSGVPTLHREVLFFYFSRGDIKRAVAYFKKIEKEVNAINGMIEPSLAEMYLSHMLQLDDPTEALATLKRLEFNYLIPNNKSVSFTNSSSSSGSSSSGGSGATESPKGVLNTLELKVGALLYAKVVNVLLRTNKTIEAELLMKTIQAKNLTLESNQVHLFMSQELRLGCAKGAVDAFGMFFPDIDTKCPDSRAVSVLTIALKRLNDTKLSTEYSLRLFPHVNELGPQLRPPVYGLLARFATDGRHPDEAAGYILKVPIPDRSLVPYCEVGKSCAESGRSDLLLLLLQGASSLSFYPELLGHIIVSSTKNKLYTDAIKYEKILYDIMSSQSKLIPWTTPFSLLSAIKSNNNILAMRIFNNYEKLWKVHPSELDFNLIIFSILKTGITAKTLQEAKINFIDLFILSYRMQELQYGLHPIVRDFNPFHPSLSPGFSDLLCGVKQSFSVLKSVQSPSAKISIITEIKNNENDGNVESDNGYGGINDSDNNDKLSRNNRKEEPNFIAQAAGAMVQNLNKNNFGFSDLIGSNEESDDCFSQIEINLNKLDSNKNNVKSNAINNEKDNKILNTDKNKGKSSTYPSRVWTPSNINWSELESKKVVKKPVTWPLKSNSNTLTGVLSGNDGNENNWRNNGDGEYNDSDNDIEGNLIDGNDIDNDGDMLGEDYFNDKEWLLKKSKLIHFSASELEKMNFMETLELFESSGNDNPVKSLSIGNSEKSKNNYKSDKSYESDFDNDEGDNALELNGPGSILAQGQFRSRRRMARPGSRSDQESSSSPNLDALLSMSNMNMNMNPYFNNINNDKNATTEGSPIDTSQSQSTKTRTTTSTSTEGSVSSSSASNSGTDSNPGSGPRSSPGSGFDPGSASTSPSEAEKRANLMQNMRRLERIELLTNKRKDR